MNASSARALTDTVNTKRYDVHIQDFLNGVYAKIGRAAQDGQGQIEYDLPNYAPIRNVIAKLRQNGYFADQVDSKIVIKW